MTIRQLGRLWICWFDVYPPNTTWNDVGGVYIFTYLNAQNRWPALYIGIADSFKNRLPNHDRWAEAQRAGATHIHARVVSPEASRQTIERELIRMYQPPLNTQHK
jgi:excinuclease UvrABC nuclease subunit